MGLNLARVPLRCSGEVKEGLLKLVDEAVDHGWSHARACRVLGVSDVRVHRWRARRRDVGTLIDRAAGGNPVHRIWFASEFVTDIGLENSPPLEDPCGSTGGG